MLFTKKIVKEPELIEDVKFDVTDAINKLELSVNEEGLREYSKLAAKLGHRSPELIKETILMLFKKHDITVYNYDNVKQHLSKMFGDELKESKKKYPNMKTGWLWYPIGDYKKHVRQTPGNFQVGDVDIWDQYDKPIPFKTLQIIEKLSNEMASLSFYVSDIYKSHLRKLDPFLMCGHNGLPHTDRFVIDYWDEPDFQI